MANTTPKLLLGFALVFSGGLFGCSITNEQPRQYMWRSTNPEELSEVCWHEKPSRETLQNIKVARVSLTKDQLNKVAGLAKEPENGPRWLMEETPDTTRSGRWKTQLDIFDDFDADHFVRIELIDHVSGGVKYTWLNDKLLFVEVWWGRIACTDFILNTETRKFLYIEDAFHPVLQDDNLPDSSKK
jgi:hypothetical protein